MREPQQRRPQLASRRATNLAIAGLVGQVGCLTVIIIGAALVLGLWLDSRLDTKPFVTLVLLLGSVPVTLVVMFRVALSSARRLQTGSPDSEKTNSDDN
ncbi:MAG: AtpZ/AtpI family protein [Methyloligellaceae bacterium]